MLLGAASWAGEAFGVWKLNPARSTLAGNQKSVTLRIEPHTRGEVFTLDTVAADGRASTFSTILYFDGKARDFQDSACSGTQSSRRWTAGRWRSCANVLTGATVSSFGDQACRRGCCFSKLRNNMPTAAAPSSASSWKSDRSRCESSREEENENQRCS